jgi:hypothetical protein
MPSDAESARVDGVAAAINRTLGKTVGKVGRIPANVAQVGRGVRAFLSPPELALHLDVSLVDKARISLGSQRMRREPRQHDDGEDSHQSHYRQHFKQSESSATMHSGAVHLHFSL